MKRPTKLSLLAFALGLVPAVGTAQNKVQIEITFTNTAPSGGLWLMRPWIGLHDGKLPTFTVGEAANSGIQHIAEDGATGDPTDLLPPANACSGLSSVYSSSAPCQFEIFNNYANHGQQATIGNPTRPGATISATFSVDPNDPDSQFLSYLVMMIPSNDAFFGTDTAHPIQLFKNGVFNGGKGPITIPVMFSDILDAGTEVNSETPADTAFAGQAVNGTGTHPDTNAVVHAHDLFGNGILSASNMFGGTLNKFDQANFQGQVGLITIRQQTAVQISFANTAPTDGLWLMRPWIGLHDGKFSLATTLAGTTATFNGIAAPVLYASSTQTSVQVPYALAGSTSAKVVVMNGSVTTAAFEIDVAASAPGLFTADYSGSGQVVAFNQDGTVNSPGNPAAKGSVVLLFATGEGMTAPAGQDGLIQDNFLRQPVLPVGMTIGGATADVFYAGSAPGSVAGVMEVEAMIPSGAASGALPVSLTVGSNSSQANATISVLSNRIGSPAPGQSLVK